MLLGEHIKEKKYTRFYILNDNNNINFGLAL